LNAFYQGTLISFESYDASKAALDALYGDDTFNRGTDRAKSTVKKQGFVIRQLIIKTGGAFAIRQYVSSKDHIYILTAASRKGETAEMRRFLDSLEIRAESDSGPTPVPAVVPFSKLHSEDVQLQMQLEDNSPEPDKNGLKATPKADDPAIEKVII